MKQYTAGMLAELAGVSSRTIRYYDQKGILHPTGYSEGGYRLYDDTALLKMQQISMLKFAGFSLEDIQSVLLMEDRALPEILEDQRQLLIDRRDKINEVIELLDRVMEEDNLGDLTELTASMKLIRRVNHSGRTYQFCDRHGQRDLYPWEFDRLELKPGMKTLDLGCGYGLLWRKNWGAIPENAQITLVDIYGNLLDQVQTFVEEQRPKLRDGVELRLVEADAEQYPMEAGYDRVVMAYLWKYLKEPEALLERARDALRPDGMLCLVCGSHRIMRDYEAIYRQFAGQPCLDLRMQQVQAEMEEMERALRRVFPRVEVVSFDNTLTFTHALDLYRFLMDSYKELVDAIRAQGVGFVNFLRQYVARQGTVTLHSQVLMYRCRKGECNTAKQEG